DAQLGVLEDRVDAVGAGLHAELASARQALGGGIDARHQGRHQGPLAAEQLVQEVGTDVPRTEDRDLHSRPCVTHPTSSPRVSARRLEISSTAARTASRYSRFFALNR